jgi:hypothetical protein
MTGMDFVQPPWEDFLRVRLSEVTYKQITEVLSHIPETSNSNQVHHQAHPQEVQQAAPSLKYQSTVGFLLHKDGSGSCQQLDFTTKESLSMT